MCWGCGATDRLGRVRGVTVLGNVDKGQCEVPHTLNPQPSTLNSQPATLNPQPSTLNPQPSTLNPQPPLSHTHTFSLSLSLSLAIYLSISGVGYPTPYQRTCLCKVSKPFTINSKASTLHPKPLAPHPEH